MKKTPLRRMSKAKSKDMAKYRKLKSELFSEFRFCEFPDRYFPTCGSEATEVHHQNGRVGPMLTDRKYLWLLCREHHRWLHDNAKAARAMGLLK